MSEHFEKIGRAVLPILMDSRLSGQVAQAVEPLMVEAAGAWHPIVSAPDDGSLILVWWPTVRLSEDDPDTVPTELTGEGAITTTRRYSADRFEEPDFVGATGEWFGDDHEYAAMPSHWRHLPLRPDASVDGPSARPDFLAAARLAIASAISTDAEPDRVEISREAFDALTAAAAKAEGRT